MGWSWPRTAGSYRKGFFLGDGTGAGKGRQVAACILDNWLQGRRRHIWITKNEPLLEDARRDWTALGGLSADIQPLSNWKIDEPIRLDQGVLFVTYPTLRSARSDHTRLQQILDWAGADFDGVIAFDEAHEMGGVAGGEGALGPRRARSRASAACCFRTTCPAPVCSTRPQPARRDVNNLAYAVRLGLWGPETAFADREQFISEHSKGRHRRDGTGRARPEGAPGSTWRARSASPGSSTRSSSTTLTPTQIEIYDTYADAWGVIHRTWSRRSS